jgi:primosomal protein N''
MEALEARLSDLSTRQMQATDVVERNRLEREIRAVKTALLHYRSALEIESMLK